MKSIFKRSLAAASGAALVLGQMVSVANVNAVDTTGSSKGLTVDKAFVVNVPIDEKDPLKDGQRSNWNSLLESKLLEMCTDGQASGTFSIASVKNKVKAHLPENKYVTAADWDALLAALSNQAKVQISDDGNFTITAEYGEAGATVGKLVENYFNQRNIDIKHSDGTPLVVDWSKFKTAATFKITGKINFAGKSVTYQSAIVVDGKEYTDVNGVETLISNKLKEGINLVVEAAKAEGRYGESFAKKMANCNTEIDNRSGVVKAFANAVYNAQIKAYQGDSAEDAYTAFKADEINAIRNASGVSAQTAGKVADKIDAKAPATISGALSNATVVEVFDLAVKGINEKADGKLNVTLTTANINEILSSGSKFDIQYPNGTSVQGQFQIPDDQNADLLAAAIAANIKVKDYKDKYDIVFEDGSVVTDFDQDYKLVKVESYKVVSASLLTKLGAAGSASYDVERKITKLVVEKPEETTTSTTITSTDTETTTTTTTTYATYVSFEVEGVEDSGLIYWSEETADFGRDLKNLSVKMHFIVAGKDKTDDIVDVTDAFKLEGNNAKELGIELAEGVGIMHQPVNLLLTEDGAKTIQNTLTAKGYDASLVAQDGLVAGKVGGFITVTLVLRGDTDLNGVIEVSDAQQALQYYVSVVNAKNKLSGIAGTYWLVNSPADKAIAFTPYSHYATDTHDGNGIDSVDDAQEILNYYTKANAHNLDANDPWNFIGSKVTPLDELHADPLAYDTLAKTEYEAFIAANKSTN